MPDLITFAEHAHDVCVEKAKGLRFNKAFQVDGALMCSYATIIEHMGGLIVLVRGRKRTSSTAVFRSLLEAYVDYRNLFDDRSYLDSMLIKYHLEWNLVLKAALEGGNPYLADLGQVEGVPASIAEREDEIRRLRRSGVRPLNVRERFRRAGMENVYTSVYAFASSSAHNDFAALRRRHAVAKENDYALHLYKAVAAEDFRAELQSSVGFLLTASLMIHDYLKSVAKADFEALLADLPNVLEGEDARAS